MAKKKFRVVKKISHSGSGINSDTRSTEEPEETVEELKEQFFKALESLSFDVAEDFLKTRLMRPKVDTLGQYIYHLEQDLKTVSALKFAITELIEYIDNNKPNLEPDPKPEVNDDVDPEPLYTEEMTDQEFTEQFENYSSNELGEGGLEGYVREGVQKTVDLLNEILRRLLRLEERADVQKDINIGVKERLDDHEKAVHKFVDEAPKMIRNHINEALKALPSGTHTSEPNEFIIKEKGIVKKIEGVFPKEWPEMLELGSVRKNMMLTGPTGSGKSFLAERLAEALSLNFYSMSCSEGMSESEGKGWLLPLGDKGQFIYIPSAFILAYENGGLFNADEFDAIDPNVGTWFNKALASDSFYLPLRYEKPIVKKHKDFLWVACANTFGTGATTQHTARNQLDRATIDRHLIGTVYIGYDSRVESKIIDPEILLWGQTLRAAMKDLQKESEPVSTRFMVDATDMKLSYPDKWSLLKIETKFFQAWARDDVTRCKAVMRNIVESMLRD